MTLLSFPLFSLAGLRGLPGLAPAGEVLFFASPKQSTQKKGDPGVCDPVAAQRGNLRCSRQAGAAQTRLTPQTCASLDPPAAVLLGTATRVVVTEYPIQQGRAMARPCGVRLSAAGLSAVGRAEQRRDEGIKRRACLSPQGEFARLPLVASSARNPAGALTPARLFFGDFLLAKQKKVTALPGAYPGNAALPGHYAESKV